MGLCGRGGGGISGRHPGRKSRAFSHPDSNSLHQSLSLAVTGAQVADSRTVSVLIALVRQATNTVQLAKAALRVFLERKSKLLASEMANVQEQATTNLSIMMGQQHSQRSQADLYDYDFLKDSIGVSQFSNRVPGIVASFRSQYFDIESWRKAVKNCEKMLNESEAASEAFVSEADAEWLKMTMYLAAVEEAERNYEFIVVDRDGALGYSSRSSSE